MLESIQMNDFTQAAERSHRRAPIPESRNQAVYNLLIDAQKEYEQSKHKIRWQ